MTSNHHAPYDLGYTRATMGSTTSCEVARAQPLLLVAIIQLGTLARLPVTNRRKVGMTSNHHAPYDLGYTRATMGSTTSCEVARLS